MTKPPLRLFDNTRISDFKRCPRLFYFRHERGWVSSGAKKAALAFGSGWHAAMDRLWATIADREPRSLCIEAAYQAFCNSWIKEGMPPPAEIDLSLAEELSPRTPANALEMINAYYEKRLEQILQLEIVEIERPFAVPLSPSDPTLFYVGRIDKIVRPNASGIRGIEHKTTTAMRLNGRKEHRIAPMFTESFSPNSQVDGYSYALRLLFQREKHYDIWVDAALVHKVGEDFMFIPVERQMAQLDAWLWETHYWINRIETERLALTEAKASDPYMQAFPKQTNSCFDFNTQCQYLGLCKSRPNPLTWDETPGGYKEERWDPLDHIGTPAELK